MRTFNELPEPAFFNPANAKQWGYRPDYSKLFLAGTDWVARHGIKPAATDDDDITLLLIDMQKDFCFPEGTLYVGGRSGTGAIDDSERMARFIYRNLANITQIRKTFDTHFLFQIFFAWFWVDKYGKPLNPWTIITTDMVRSGEAKPNPAVCRYIINKPYTWVLKQVEFYCAELERGGQYALILWPPHCILGSDGHAIVGLIEEATAFHNLARVSQSWGEVKGGNFLTENYGAIKPEVLMTWDGKPLAEKNKKLVTLLARCKRLIIAGQASSHCVATTEAQLMDEFLVLDKELLRKIYIVTDCMSAVVSRDDKGNIIPGLDFTDKAADMHQKFADAGMHLVKSTTPLRDWPDFAF